MSKWKNLSDIRRDYGSMCLSETEVDSSPFVQFEQWFAEVLGTEKSDPTAMVLSTVDEKGHPDSRVVLLKEIEEEHFIFYTNYQSTKAIQLSNKPYAALNFYWPQMARQVRIRGQVTQTTSAQSNDYFASRPKMSQLSAIASPQSSEIRDRAQLEHRLNELIEKYQTDTILRPLNWGGYKVLADEIEFWQGRDNRLHDRIQYYRSNEAWLHRRLAP